jgi:uncharacterized protein YhbP (UPF0306 family)
VTRLETIAELLRSQNTLTLATSAAGCAPRSAPLFYLPGDGLRLYWFSSASSEHSRILKANPAAAVTVYRPAEGWREIRGVQMRGTVSAVTGPSRLPIERAYAEHFHLGKFLQAAVSRSRLYVFEPSWARYIDNSRRFGYRFEVRLALQ